MPKRLLTKDFFRKTSSYRRLSGSNIFSQKMLQPNIFSQKTQKVNCQATTSNHFLLL